MIRAGLVEEGLEVTRAVRGRYAGHNRNPYAEIESGYYYSRALSSWSVFQALSGFEYDGVSKNISFNPVYGKEDFSTFWSTGSGWGNYMQSDKGITLAVEYGRLEIERLVNPQMLFDSKPETKVNGKSIHGVNGVKGSIAFSSPLVLNRGDVLSINRND